jgi:hypothetical protein
LAGKPCSKIEGLFCALNLPKAVAPPDETAGAVGLRETLCNDIMLPSSFHARAAQFIRQARIGVRPELRMGELAEVCLQTQFAPMLIEGIQINRTVTAGVGVGDPQGEPRQYDAAICKVSVLSVLCEPLSTWWG